MSYYYPQACIKLRILPEDFKLNSDASTQKTLDLFIIPKSCTVEVGDHKTGDKFSCELDYKNFPFDPRFMRSCGVIIYMQDMKGLLDKDGSSARITPGADNEVFRGFVDENLITLDDTQRTIRLEGRDFTALLIDQKYKEQVPIAEDKPLDEAIRVFLATFPATREIQIVNRTGKETLPILGKFAKDATSQLANSKNTGAKETYWDIIQGAVNRAGLICYIDLYRLVITTPRNLYDKSKDLKFIYGQNVKSLTFKRKLGRQKGFNIRVRSRSGTEVIEANIPEEASQEWCNSFGIPKEAVKIPVLTDKGVVDTSRSQVAPYITFPIPKIAKKEVLIEIGQTVFEDLSRQQMEGALETHEMVGHAGVTPDDPNWKVYDFTKLDLGQPISIEIEMDDITKISRLASVSERTTYLLNRGYAPELASIFAESMGKFSPRFFTKSYKIMTDESGFRLNIDFINIIETSFKGLN